ncbi:MAG: hypothetical protein IJT79_08280 [Ruminococcus sp.]|nr:hypothetical protein [Ruminococcus sp.]
MRFNIYYLAIALTHFLFKNTDIISRNSGVKLNDIFFEETYIAVQKQFQSMDKILPTFYERVYYRNDYMKIINELILNDTFTLTTTNKFIISYNYCQYISVAWGKPEAILDRNISDRAMFILQGLFKVFCEAGQVFDDKAYLYIRKDIYNRIYTLICLSRITIPHPAKSLSFPKTK